MERVRRIACQRGVDSDHQPSRKITKFHNARIFLIFDTKAIETDLSHVTLPGLDFSSAERLKYLHGLKEEIKAELSDPSDWFVREMAVRVHSAQRITGQLQEKFKPIVIDAIKAYINDRINEGPSTAMEVEKSAAEAPVVEQAAEEESGGTVYTDEKRRPLHCEGNLRSRNRPHETHRKRHKNILRH